MTRRYIVDLFAGPGGWSEGIRDLLPPDVVEVGIEWDEAACRTRAAAGHLTVRADVGAYPTSAFAAVEVDGLIASPPCQTFSLAGGGTGRRDLDALIRAIRRVAAGDSPAHALDVEHVDERSRLVLEPVRWVRDLRPRWIALEQVPPVLPVWQVIAHTYRTLGYAVETAVVNSADYGVPQTRRRAVLVARRDRRTVALPATTHAHRDEIVPGDADLLFVPETRRPWVSMAEALGWADTVTVRQQRGEGMVERHGDRPERQATDPAPTITAGARRQLQVQDRTTAEPEPDPPPVALRNGTQANAATRPIDEPAGTLFFGARLNAVEWITAEQDGPDEIPPVRFADRARPPGELESGTIADGMTWDSWGEVRPSTTVSTTGRVPPPGYRQAGERAFGTGSVRITVEEAAVLQSFPRDYPWQGGKTKAFQQVGNAVPPGLARAIVAPFYRDTRE